ncbi:tRNA (N6-isopentenyl adenosine(37)-C2)-methylthiotransferase MiaB [Candidatus Aerophobetes bacterium]|uniref:tRNA-2-methylthio-N(6)-dimethylallyladenosine synthase n=1 Tax=Aerophobetes bacterium TaxID=2030807 RepID=A0A497E2F0_UNCAE|nr:MAG: tRNA (N6-isopentenyl adenosine(37)-C2)-methylthiotransferase MiaB [Candidatus Aerophobetes bacterium]
MFKKAYIKTYGCQMNEYDSEVMAGLLTKDHYQLTSKPEEADLIILNTCYVREKVKQKVYSKLGEIKKLKEKNPHLILGVCGCVAQRRPEEVLQQAPYVDFILGTFNFYRLPLVVRRVRESGERIVDVEERETIPEKLPKLRKNRFSAYVPIMRGCDNFCTYCNVPYVRGRERSRLPEDILREVEELSCQGYKEVTLLGQNVNSYGKGLENRLDFADLLTRINCIEGIERIRFTTSHPKDITDKLIQRMRDLDKVCEHLHLPVQAGSNKVLKRMRRGYTKERYLELVDKIRKTIPQISLTTDIIVGFPGESEQDFQETLDLVRKVEFDGAFTFCYSRIKGTEAAEFEDQLPEEVKKERLRRLIQLQREILEKRNKSLVGQKFEVLVEGLSKKSSDELQGRTRTNKVVVFKGSPDLVGKLVQVKIVDSSQWALRGEICG